MKRFSYFLLPLAAVAFGTAIDAGNSAAEAQRYRVVVQSLSVRQRSCSASRRCPIVGSLRRGQIVFRRGQRGRWLRIRRPRGWVASRSLGGKRYLVRVGAVSRAFIVTASALRVRAGRSTRSRIVEVALTGDRLTRRGRCRGRWCPVRFQGVNGWVAIRSASGRTRYVR